MKNILRHLSSFIAPIVVCLVLPYLVVVYEHQSITRPLTSAPISRLVVGALIAAAGFILFSMTVRMFILIGNGTIMPWDPTRKLIVASLYGHVRNPMILSVLIILVGEAVIFASIGIALLAVLFLAINTVYFIYSEEPGLEKRFGEEYLEYKRSVPRWVPRLKPWRPPR